MPTLTAAQSSLPDTARWVANVRAIESARADAVLRDPLAARLVGAHAARMPEVTAWPILARTKLFDALVQEAVRAGADLVINLAAGFDTRPYRLTLPRSLTWVEADFPALLEEKERLLAGQTPVCTLHREPVDLSDTSARSAFLERTLAGSKRAVVMTEGLLLYLEPALVVGLARDLHARAEVHTWLIDLMSPATLAKLKTQTDPLLAEHARMRFAPPEGVSFFTQLGFRVESVHSLLREAVRLNRAPLFLRLLSLLPEADPARPGNRPWGAVVSLRRHDR